MTGYPRRRTPTPDGRLAGVAAAPFRTTEPLPGLRVVTERMPYVRSVSIGIWVDVGSRDERDELAGASHLLEHLLFKGTPTRSARQIADAFDAVGGELNAYTSREHTCYYARVLDDDVPMATDVMLDMHQRTLLRDEDVEAERKVVLEELHMAADVPEERIGDLFGETILPSHPLGRPVAGSLSTVGAMTRDDLFGYYRDAYVPGRTVVVAAGNVDHEALTAGIVEAMDESGVPHRRTVPEGIATTSTAVYEQRTTEQVHLTWGCGALARTDPDRYALAVLNSLYGGGISSRLFQEVREERGLVYTIYSGYQLFMETGIFSVYAGTQEATASEVLEIVRSQAAGIAGGDVTADEVERAKGAVRGGLVLSMDDPGGRMSRLGKAVLVHDEIVTVDDLLARVDAVTTDDVIRVAGRLFSGGSTLACLGPVSGGTLDRFVEPL